MLKGITAYELLDLFVSYNDIMSALRLPPPIAQLNRLLQPTL
jgi:hypothetical protein